MGYTPLLIPLSLLSQINGNNLKHRGKTLFLITVSYHRFYYYYYSLFISILLLLSKVPRKLRSTVKTWAFSRGKGYNTSQSRQHKELGTGWCRILITWILYTAKQAAWFRGFLINTKGVPLLAMLSLWSRLAEEASRAVQN